MESSTPGITTDKEDEASWRQAGHYAELIGSVHPVFLRGIRALQQLERGDKQGKASEHYQVTEVMRSATLRSVLYHAAKAIYTDKLADHPKISGPDLLDLFSPYELASVLCAAFLFRRTSKQCPGQVWSKLASEINGQIEIGALLGNKIPAIGKGRGVLVGSIRYIAFGLLASQDEHGFKKYKRHLNSSNLLSDLSMEVSGWGCNHLQIAAILLQTLGMGIAAAKGTATVATPLSIEQLEMDSDTLAWYAGARWIESMIEKECAPPELSAYPDLFPGKAEIATLQKLIDGILQEGCDNPWINKRAQDIQPQLAKQLAMYPEVSESDSQAEKSEEEIL